LVALLTDPARTAVNLVTTAEEMPVNETIEMYRQLRDELRMPTGLLFVNRVHDTDFSDRDVAQLEAAAARSKAAESRDVLEQVAARAREEAGWSRLNARYRAKLADEIGARAVELPFLFAEEFGFAEVKELAEQMSASRRKREARA
jgi:anion-transporting  ArsA/GET3 family ATPase